MRVSGRLSFLAHDRQTSTAAAFSFTELLAVLGVLGLLAVLQVSALAHNKGNSHRAVCADNLRRLALAWLMYADDNRGRLAPNRPGGNTNDWVASPFDSPGSGPDDPRTITLARLYPYNRAIAIYRCPEDSWAVNHPRTGLRMNVRSYSMNGWVGDGASGWVATPDVFQKMVRHFQVRQPDQTFVFLEEHFDSINDGVFVVDEYDVGRNARLIDFPAAYHALGANLGFADGSVRFRHWVDARTTPPVTVTGTLTFNVASPNNPDVAWLQRITT